MSQYRSTVNGNPQNAEKRGETRRNAETAVKLPRAAPWRSPSTGGFFQKYTHLPKLLVPPCHERIGRLAAEFPERPHEVRLETCRHLPWIPMRSARRFLDHGVDHPKFLEVGRPHPQRLGGRRRNGEGPDPCLVDDADALANK